MLVVYELWGKAGGQLVMVKVLLCSFSTVPSAARLHVQKISPSFGLIIDFGDWRDGSDGRRSGDRTTFSLGLDLDSKHTSEIWSILRFTERGPITDELLNLCLHPYFRCSARLLKLLLICWGSYVLLMTPSVFGPRVFFTLLLSSSFSKRSHQRTVQQRPRRLRFLLWMRWAQSLTHFLTDCVRVSESINPPLESFGATPLLSEAPRGSAAGGARCFCWWSWGCSSSIDH